LPEIKTNKKGGRRKGHCDKRFNQIFHHFRVLKIVPFRYSDKSRKKSTFFLKKGSSLHIPHSPICSRLLSLKQESVQLIRKHTKPRINLIVWMRSLQIFNAILLRFSRRLRNSPRPWVRHAQRPATPDALKKLHQKAKSSMSLKPYNQIYQAYFQLSIYVCIILLAWIIHESRLPQMKGTGDEAVVFHCESAVTKNMR